MNIDSVTYDSLANQSEDLPGTDQEIFGSSLPNNRSSVSLSAYLSSNADLNGDRYLYIFFFISMRLILCLDCGSKTVLQYIIW